MDNERKMFEEYISNLKLTRLHLGKWEDLQYKNPEVMDFWKGWQARAAIQVQPVAFSMVGIARRNLASYLSKAAFACSVDRDAALNCLDVLNSAIAAPPSPPLLTDEQIIEFAHSFMTHDNGRDYYAYMDVDHWWGERKEVIDFARSIIAQARGEQ